MFIFSGGDGGPTHRRGSDILLNPSRPMQVIINQRPSVRSTCRYAPLESTASGTEQTLRAALPYPSSYGPVTSVHSERPR